MSWNVAQEEFLAMKHAQCALTDTQKFPHNHPYVMKGSVAPFVSFLLPKSRYLILPRNGIRIHFGIKRNGFNDFFPFYLDHDESGAEF